MALVPIIILTALRSEGRAIARGMGLWRSGAGFADADAGISVEVIGPAAASLARMTRPQAGWVIVAGLGGGLDPALKPGEIVIDGAPPEVSLPVGTRRGRIVSAQHIVRTPAEKAALYGQSGGVVVDMEQAAVAAAVPGRGIIGVRIVLDSAGEEIPASLAGLVDARGRSRPGAALVLAITSPGAMIAAARLGVRSARLLPRLGAAVADLVGALRRA